MKLRQQRGAGGKNAIYYYSEDVAERKYNEWQKAINKNIASMELTTEMLEQVAPPDMATTELEIKPVHISSPSVFWIQYGPRAEEVDGRLHEILASCHRSMIKVEEGTRVRRNELYIAPYRDQGEEESFFYRARVDSVQGNTATVFFIDYGNMVTVDKSELLVISPRLMKEHPDLVRLPGLALECCVARLQPSRIRNSKGLWDGQAEKRFKQLLEVGEVEGRIMGKIFSVTKSQGGHSKVVVNLESLTLVQHGAEDREARAMLMEEQLAEAATESYISQQDHEDRQNYRAYHSAMQKHLDNYAKYETKAVSRGPNNKESNRMQTKVEVTGPFSPLEHKVQCLHRHGSTKQANIEQDSVNSVLLDQSPGDSYDHYLVAAHVGMNPGGETLQLRNTTWLPARPGLGAFATMMFAPCVEMRTNQEKTRLTGCVTGLGPRTHWDRPVESLSKAEFTEAFYPEHDIETRFDVNVSNQDVNTINKVRFWINRVLSRDEPTGMLRLTQPVSLDKAQKGIRRNLEDLFGRERNLEVKEAQASGLEYRWNMLKRQDRMESKVNEQDLFIYKVSH